MTLRFQNFYKSLVPARQELHRALKLGLVGIIIQYIDTLDRQLSERYIIILELFIGGQRGRSISLSTISSFSKSHSIKISGEAISQSPRSIIN